jgi:Ca2+-binding RTX toxin-like protein
VLLGGDGNDQFVYASRTGSGFDSIFDFSSGADQFRMTASEYGLTAGATLSAGSSFISGAGPAATSAIPTFLYNTATGILTCDLDGTGATYASVSIAQLFAAPALTASDFAFV